MALIQKIEITLKPFFIVILQMTQPVAEPKYKVVVASYTPMEQFFKIPSHWNEDDIHIKWGELYYKNEIVDVKTNSTDTDNKYPMTTEINTYEDYSFWFDGDDDTADTAENETENSDDELPS